MRTARILVAAAIALETAGPGAYAELPQSEEQLRSQDAADNEIASETGSSSTPPLLRCVGATLAGSVFAFFKMLYDNFKERKEAEQLENSKASKGQTATELPSSTESNRSQQTLQRRGGAPSSGDAPENSADRPWKRSCMPGGAEAKGDLPESAGDKGGKMTYRPPAGSAAKGDNERGSSSLTEGRSPNQAARQRAVTAPAGNPEASASEKRRPTLFSTMNGGRAPTEAEKTERQIKSVLNKMTRDTFDKLYVQLVDCCVKSEAGEEVVEIVARTVFSKATVQHSFVEMYADVCSKLSEDLQAAGNEVNFRRVLLDQCQQSFNQHLEMPALEPGLDRETEYEHIVRYKTKMLGNVKLIGQLLHRKMLSPKILFHVAEELLTISSAEALETLAAFLRTIGAAFDTPSWNGFARLEGVFMRIELMAQDTSKVEARLRCLLQDVLDLRKNGWKERKLPEAPVQLDRPKESTGSLPEKSPTASPGGSWRDTNWRDKASGFAASPKQTMSSRLGVPSDKNSDKLFRVDSRMSTVSERELDRRGDRGDRLHRSDSRLSNGGDREQDCRRGSHERDSERLSKSRN
eukprot:TRINITY_DN91579_c0_g1_i1.p1 TRINITY_DN91579_c0_g1~~TRINITY_DN91579_c0_g1_i1.p1  ORF type:complete len:578 (-),score=143.94 TRINITY_DN91579_c0_g1_i1:102-1835(-)